MGVRVFISFLSAVSLLAIPLYVGAQTSDKPSQTQTSNKKSSVDYFATDRAKKARQNWILNCQGCHKIDGTGRPEKGLPNLTGEVARFLHTPGGREYLSRVPGVTNASINDEDLTDLINWLLVRFDPEHIPQGHQPYTVQEVSQGRAHPLSIGAADKRADLLLALSKNTKN